LPIHTKIKETVDLVGPDRVMYGSDLPFGHPAFELKKVEVSGLSDEEIEGVLGENALKLFHLETNQ
jgi:predicted TIM-barrel fold metal-dependent hydrolase